MKIRSFLAFDIPEDVKKVLAKVVDDFSKKEKGVNWIPTENMHVTMKFFGEINEDLLLGEISDAVEQVTKKFEPIVLDCSGVGVFPDWKYPKVIWAGFIGEIDKVLDFQKMIEVNLKKFPIKKDERAFRLHLTMGRTKATKIQSGLMKLIEKLGPITFGEMKIDHLTLYKSVLTKSGAVYTPVKSFVLGEG